MTSPYLAALAVAGSALVASVAARAPAAPRATVRSDSLPVLAAFFKGEWSCAGGSPSGRVLNSTVSFSTTLGDRFLKSEHNDTPPGRYMSIGLWPVSDTSSSMATVVYDNAGGARRFIARRWGTDSIVWVRDTTEHGARLETFTYKRIAADQYWYAWHLGAAGRMVLGDSATCRRK